HHERAAKMFSREEKCVGGSQSRVDHVHLERAETQQKHCPLASVIARPAGLYVSKQEPECSEQKKSGQDLVVYGAAYHRERQTTIDGPQPGRQAACSQRAGKTSANRR